MSIIYLPKGGHPVQLSPLSAHVALELQSGCRVLWCVKRRHMRYMYEYYNTCTCKCTCTHQHTNIHIYKHKHMNIQTHTHYLNNTDGLPGHMVGGITAKCQYYNHSLVTAMNHSKNCTCLNVLITIYSYYHITWWPCIAHVYVCVTVSRQTDSH